MRNAVNAIERIDEAQAFNYGVSHWNSTVFTYVPAQIVGHAFKDSLLIEVPNIFARGYEQSIGSTPTGMTDSFASFWYFGAAKFFLIAATMGMAYSSACRGNTVMQMTYMLSAVPSMLAITHFTNEIVIAWIHMFIFLFPAFYYARSESSELPLEGTRSSREWHAQHR